MLGRPVIRFEVVSSTMDVLSQLAARGAHEGTVVVADYQARGRGRSDRQWGAPPGTALLHSILLRPGMAVHHLSPLSILVADAVVATLRDLFGMRAHIKWPNDVLIGNRKICGILIQTRMYPADAHPAVLVGVGINANVKKADMPAGGTSVLMETGRDIDRDELMRSFLDQLDVRYRELRQDDLHDRWDQVQGKLAMRGELVSVIDGDAVVTGCLAGIDTTGALLLQTDDPHPRRIVVGDLIRGPRPIKNADN